MNEDETYFARGLRRLRARAGMTREGTMAGLATAGYDEAGRYPGMEAGTLLPRDCGAFLDAITSVLHLVLQEQEDLTARLAYAVLRRFMEASYVDELVPVRAAWRAEDGEEVSEG